MKKLTTYLILLLSVASVRAQNALDFDGNNDLVQTNCGGVTGNSDRTFEAWIYVPTSAPTTNKCIMDYGSSAAASRNTFIVTGGGALSYIAGGTNTNIGSTGNVVPFDTWTHVAMVLEAGTGTFYVNGVPAGSGNLSGVNTPANATGVRIGNRVSGGSIPYTGKVDEVRMWNVARTQTEIQNNMNAELCQGSANLILYLQFNQGTANGNNSGLTTVTDLSNNGITGTLTNFGLNGATSNWTTGAPLATGMTASTSQASACDTYTWDLNSQTYTSSGTYSAMVTGTSGCDSLVNLDLTINTANDLTTNQTSCDSYFWSVNSQTYSTSDTVVENLTAGNGCPYTHTLNLTINESYENTDTVEACASFTWAGDGQTYTATGVYIANLTTSKGCDSTLTLDLTIGTIDNTITDNGDSTMTANEANATYQWLYCDSALAAIPGATSQTYQAQQNGNYAVVVNNGVCTDTSACMLIDYLGLQSGEEWKHLSFYPNPTAGKYTIDLGKKMSGAVHAFDLNGRLVMQTSFENENLLALELRAEPGIYTVVVENSYGGQTHFKLTIK